MPRPQQHHIAIPARLLGKLAAFRRALLWQVARDHAVRCLLVVMLVFWVLLLADRFIETPGPVRLILFAVIGATSGIALLSLWKVVWDCRSPLGVAAVIRRRDPVYGDHLVGALELADCEAEQARSVTLCVAALEQVADEATARDFHQALPESRAGVMVRGLIALLAPAVVVLAVAPAMVWNTASRLGAPLATIERFTFVKFTSLPEEKIVPRDEPADWMVALDPDSRWVPRDATLRIGDRRITARLIRSDPTEAARYAFLLPRMFEPASAQLRIGDARGQVRLLPKLRPELTDVVATVRLPEYLSHRSDGGTVQTDFSDGVITIVEGAAATLRLTVSSVLASASVDAAPVEVQGNRFAAELGPDAESIRLDWTDQDGLTAAEPMVVAADRVADQRPTLMVDNDGIPPRVLDSQALRFTVTARDDFGIRRVGMQWSTANGDDLAESGERVLGSGDDSGSFAAVFQATSLDAPPGEVRVVFWAEDDFPGRERVYSDPVAINVLTADEHAVWIAGQFARWRQSAMDVRDRELNLFSRNRELAQVGDAQRDDDWRAAVAEQARAEAFNGRQLESLTAEGESLLRQAAGNDEVAVDYVEKLAATIKTLQQLSDQRMPRVADLLDKASKQNASKQDDEDSKFADLAGQESSQGTLAEQPGDETAEDSPQSDDEQSTQQIGLAGTTIIDTSKRSDKEETEDAEEDALQIAIEDQTDLVAEFDAVAEELKELMGNMEGSTLVKRLKSVSRLQDRIAMQLGRGIESTFGGAADANGDRLESVVADANESASRVRTVLDDLEAFCERREIKHFQSVLDEMKKAQVLEQLNASKDRVVRRPGVSISVAEYWADNLDRWADDLVDPGSEQAESGPQNKKSLSPALVVEVLRILEAEVTLREQTRVAEQGRTAMASSDYFSEAIRLSESQDVVRDRLDAVVDTIEALPDGALNFGEEIEVLSLAIAAMVDASKTLVTPETGPVAVAAQTEAIELLLRSNKVSPEGGGGGGGSAGGGQGGETDQAAIALLGEGLNQLALTRQSATALSVGRDRREVPERWRSGLDLYFDRLEQRRSAANGEAGR
ncbi:hypothetical protein Mal15_07380 [Stieleria maiorica]|uniref:Uncharacterized protein n=1 Tax=Stieleria maiorica TaxID=2795974 RepID=A0A5B9M9J4_9BACT|nr:hypothetical protein [Stieleria maiorica]QEF96710.1 hypothetical protein Mal15_07380 [Stieleria maiorica]